MIATMIVGKNQSIDMDLISDRAHYAVCRDADGRETEHRLFILAFDSDGRPSFQTCTRKNAHELPDFIRYESKPLGGTWEPRPISARAQQGLVNGWRGHTEDLTNEADYGTNS